METLCGESGDEGCQRLRDALQSWFPALTVDVGRYPADVLQVRWCDGPARSQMQTAVGAELIRLQMAPTVVYHRSLSASCFAGAVVALHDATGEPDPVELALLLAATVEVELAAPERDLAPVVGVDAERWASSWLTGAALVAGGAAVGPVALEGAGTGELTAATEQVVAALRELRDLSGG